MLPCGRSFTLHTERFPFERSGAVWSDLEGQSWQQAEAGDTVELGTSVEQLQTWLAEGARLDPEEWWEIPGAGPL